MEHRLALLADTLQDARSKLKAFIDGHTHDGLFTGQVRRRQAVAEQEERIATWIVSADWAALVQAWLAGATIDWPLLYRDRQPRRLDLPTYPFAKDRFWQAPISTAPPATAGPAVGWLHPLLQRNTSARGQQRFTSSFDGTEFFLRDHRFRDAPVLPGAALLEMARAAAQHTLELGVQERLQLKNMVWLQPFAPGASSRELRVDVLQEEGGTLAVSMTSGAGPQHVRHSQCQVEVVAFDDVAPADLAALQARCGECRIEAQDCYAQFEAAGLVYGATHRGIETIGLGRDADGKPQALARWRLPAELAASASAFHLHPAALDAALQTAIAFGPPAGGEGAALPFSVERVLILRPTPAQGWALMRLAAGTQPQDAVRKLDLDVLDDQGVVCVRLLGLSARPVDVPAGAGQTLLLQPQWQARPVPAGDRPAYAQRWVVLSPALAAHAQALEAALPAAQCQVLPSSGGLAQRYESATTQVLALLQVVLQARPQEPVLLQIALQPGGDDSLFRGLAGLLKTARQENPRLLGQVITVPADVGSDALAAMLSESGAAPDDVQVRYDSGTRELAVLQEVQSQPGAATLWRDGGVYLLTGGAGGLGLAFARAIASRAKEPVLVLSGRAPLDADKQAQLAALRGLGARASYRQADIADALSVRGLVEGIVEEHGTLHGVLHAAGVLRDSFLMKKTTDEVRAVLAPKVGGAVALDEATRTLPLDLFVLFSSVSGAFGNIGQGDYAAANAFMDSFAAWRAAQGAPGRSLSVNWPLWEEGGMALDARVREQMGQRGLEALPTAQGVRALDQALATAAHQVVVLAGHRGRIRAAMAAPLEEKLAAAPGDALAPETAVARQELAPVLQAALVHAIAALLKVQAADVELDAEWTEFGFDSISLTQLATQLNRDWRIELAPTAFFEHQTPADLLGYLLQRWGAPIAAVLQPTQAAAQTAAPVATTSPVTAPVKRPSPVTAPTAAEGGDIAVVAMSGRFPGAASLSQLWDVLREGRDCVTEIPRSRWPLEGFYEADVERAIALGRSYSKWGGFLEGVDEFDAAFFDIPAREAAVMDPQARLFLQAVWHLLEAAGQTREGLRRWHQGRVGLYVGSMYQQYRFDHGDAVTRAISANASYSAIANRTSHFYGFEGPSVAVDTMSSSSLMAIHMACKDLRLGECEAAVAGGVNLSIDPRKYIAASQMKVIASHPGSRSFADGDGFIPAEAVGAVLLKPLQAALRDGDPLLAVIKSTSSNHSGRGGGFLVPNLQAQVRLVEDNLRKAGIDAGSISYVEAAANGSALGDAIELRALEKAFGPVPRAAGPCAIGSVKANMGHAEAASAMCQLAKVLLQLRHGVLLPTPVGERLNPNLDFSGGTFRLQRGLEPWTCDGPRRAMVNSFGAGGSYASMILEEPPRCEPAPPTEGPQLIPLSARTPAQLQAQVRSLLDHLQAHADWDLGALAHLLQCGREPMGYRVAWVVSSRPQLLAALAWRLQGAGAAGGQAPAPMCAGEPLAGTRSLWSGASGERMVQALLDEKDLEKLALAWSQGAAVPWDSLHAGRPAHGLDVPGYPFQRDRHWLGAGPSGAPAAGEGEARPA
ncbi:MAG: SDR family NAD(P)-dependent oxidoreductase [Polaromonas sp.]|nr:SDR family NAD(P)-dependent oxidoreductase [Polaromonas sp.]